MTTQQESNNYALDNLLGELALIKDLDIRNFTTHIILCAPGTFWYRPSAFFKGHHPDDEICAWGNLTHVKRVLVIAKEFSGIEDLSTQESDMLYSALVLHDIGKYGPDGLEERIQLKTHAEIAVNFILARLDADATEVQETILGIIMTHMGRRGSVKPTTQHEKVGSYCDCIASRVSVHIPIKLK